MLKNACCRFKDPQHFCFLDPVILGRSPLNRVLLFYPRSVFVQVWAACAASITRHRGRASFTGRMYVDLLLVLILQFELETPNPEAL